MYEMASALVGNSIKATPFAGHMFGVLLRHRHACTFVHFIAVVSWHRDTFQNV